MTLSMWIIALVIGIAIGAVLVMLWSMSIAKRQRDMKRKVEHMVRNEGNQRDRSNN